MNRKIKGGKKGNNFKLTEDQNRAYQERFTTYVWHLRNEHGTYHSVNYGGLSEEFISSKLPRYELVELNFDFSSQSNDQFEYYNDCLNLFFKDVLTIRASEKLYGMNLSHIRRITLPSSKLKEIDQIISEYKLEKHRDFILQLLARIQEVYVKAISFREGADERKRINNFANEVEKLITVIEYAQEKKWSDEKNFSLEQVRFSFNGYPGYITIKDPLLNDEITEAIQTYFENMGMKDWKKQLRAYPKIYNENQKNRQFRPRLAKALHLFFTEERIFELKGKKILDNEALCIGKILDVVDIPLYNKIGEQHSIIDDKNSVISLIKSWINRTEVENSPY